MVIANFEAETCYYGIMVDGENIGQLYFSSLKFIDVPKSILVKKALNKETTNIADPPLVVKNVTSLNPSKFEYPRIELSAIDDLEETELEEKIRNLLYVEFCSKEKIPFRVAYEHKDFDVISRTMEEKVLKPSELSIWDQIEGF